MSHALVFFKYCLGDSNGQPRLKTTELRDWHGWDSPKRRLSKSTNERVTLEIGEDARKSHAVALQGPFTEE